MSINEQVFIHNGVSVKYKLQDSVTDRKHLVVIFSGYGVTYSFPKIGQFFRSNVLWIRDEYQGYETYYLGKGGFDFSEAVQKLINDTLEQKNLTKDQCTLLGSSKGGFSVLYLGLKYNYPNIVSSSFSSKIGTRLKARAEQAKFVMGENNADKVKEYDGILLNLLKNEDDFSKNIYVLLAESDEFYNDHQLPLLSYLERYDNYNLLMTKSALVQQHNRVTPYNIPIIISIINSLIEGIKPSFGYAENGISFDVLTEHKQKVQPVTALYKMEIEKDLLFIEGDAFFRGLECPGYNYYTKTLLLSNESNKFQFRLGTTLNVLKSSKYFKDNYIDYSAAGFATVGFLGIDLCDLPEGVFDVSIEFSYKKKYAANRPLMMEGLDKKFWNNGEYEYRCWVDENGNVKLSKRSLLQPTLLDPYFNVSQLVVNNAELFIEGEFIVPGVETVKWDDVQYYLIVHDMDHKHIFALGKLHKEKLNGLIDYGFGVYQKSSFCSYNQKGINISSITKGTYTLTVLQSYKGCMFSHIIEKNLIVEDSENAYIQ